MLPAGEEAQVSRRWSELDPLERALIAFLFMVQVGCILALVALFTWIFWPVLPDFGAWLAGGWGRALLGAGVVAGVWLWATLAAL